MGASRTPYKGRRGRSPQLRPFGHTMILFENLSGTEPPPGA
jgi:hypothetical protein